MTEFDQDNPQFFDPERLNALESDQLVDALLADAQDTALRAPAEERARIESAVISACWIPDPEQQAVIDEKKAVIDGLFGQMFSAIAEEFEGKEIEPEEALEYANRRRAARSLAKIGRHKHDLEKGLQTGEDDDCVPWTAGSTKYYLKEICDAQKEAGIAVEVDYVRQMAVKELAAYRGLRGLVLMRSALSGDDESYNPGIESLQEAVRLGELSFGDAQEGVELVIDHLNEKNPGRRETLLNLSIDLLCHLRKWRHIQFGSYSYYYAQSAAQLAATVRDTS